jgi:exodeoxyribonuclease III
MKIATFNVNSLRRRLELVLGWVNQHQPDIMCLQETKVQDSEFPIAEIEAAGYHCAYRGMKSYNGVATLTKRKPERVVSGLQYEGDGEDSRILQTKVDGITVVNTYVPQGNSITSEKYAQKLAWLQNLRRYFEFHLKTTEPCVWLGDLNVAPEPIDVYHPDRRINDVDFHIDARNAYKAARDWGFIDVFRQLHPERLQYTYWDYFRRAFENNWGWRIDHILATAPLASTCRQVEVDLEPRKATGASDHTVVWAEFEL